LTITTPSRPVRSRAPRSSRSRRRCARHRPCRRSGCRTRALLVPHAHSGRSPPSTRSFRVRLQRTICRS